MLNQHCWFLFPNPITSQLSPTKKLSVFFPHWHLSWDTNHQHPVELGSSQLLCSTRKLSVFCPQSHLYLLRETNPKKIILFQLLLPCPTRKLSVLCPLSHSSWWLWDWRETGWSSFRIDFTKFHWRVTSIRQRGMSSRSMVIRFQELRSIWRVVNAVQCHLLIFVSLDCQSCLIFLTTMQQVQW